MNNFPVVVLGKTDYNISEIVKGFITNVYNDSGSLESINGITEIITG